MPADLSAPRPSIHIDESVISRARPDGSHDQIAWDDLREVMIQTTDAGLALSERKWVLTAATGGFTLPSGFPGEKDFVEKLRATPGFDPEAYNAALISTFDGKFLCWRRLG